MLVVCLQTKLVQKMLAHLGCLRTPNLVAIISLELKSLTLLVGALPMLAQ